MSKLAGTIPVTTLRRGRLCDAPTLQGLQCASEDPSSRDWLRSTPHGWTGCDIVKAVQLQNNNMPVKGIMSKLSNERLCRSDCSKVEPINHVLQQCSATHWKRIEHHNHIARRVAKHAREENWKTDKEPHVRHSDGILFKPDIAIHQENRITITNNSVNWEGQS